ncbi:adhesion G-protein coupled receptor G2 isoform X2 [Chelmon rostratus]|uniref:adhesion G-protein coupled receptor G2 isoform X2 n=1 Tax=Chelmon rostratus TaxID=109905 RepID=UPI001BE84751|nr:adhesion G-protein coupled receptor G2 isoform X2 [Chelmon rostratus]
MFHENEDEVMKGPGVCSGGSSCWHTFAPSVRVKKPGPGVRRLRWVHVQLLVILLAGQASCIEASTSPSPVSATTNAQTSAVYYFLDVSVNITGERKNASEITDWLIQVFQNNLESCVSPRHEETTTPPTSPQTTPASTYETTATLQSYSTMSAAPSTTLQSYSTMSAAPSTTLQSYSTMSAAPSTTLPSYSTMSPAPSTMLPSYSTMSSAQSTTLQSYSTTAAATSTASNSFSTTAAATSTASKSFSTTPAAANQLTTVAQTQSNSPAASSLRSSVITQMPESREKNRPPKNPNSSSTAKKLDRARREVLGSGIHISNYKTTGLFQGIEVKCAAETAVINTSCTVLLRLKQSVPPCCILRTLCAASRTSPDIHVVGRKAGRTSQLQNECSSDPQEENRCIYNGQAGALCEVSESAYAVQLSNSSHCRGDNNCSCSAYCNGTDAYYTFQISIQDPNINISYVLSLVSNMGRPPNCSESADVSCPLAIIAYEYKDANVTCGTTAADFQSCSVILSIAHEVPICTVSAAVIHVFESEKQISTNGRVTRAAICGNSAASDNPLKSQFTWDAVNLKPDIFCMAIEASSPKLLNCQNGKHVVVLMKEQCIQRPFTTPGPNVTTPRPNTTSSSLNVTSSPMTTIAEALSATTAVANVTVTATLSTTTTTSNESVSVTPSESPTTNGSAESQANALLDLTRDVSKLNSSQVDQLVSELENLLSGPTVSLALGNTSVHIVSNLLDASPETLADSSNRIIGIVDTVALKLVLQEQPETLLSPAVAVSVTPADGSNFKETFFSISDPSNVQVRGDPRPRRNARSASSVPQGSIKLPPSLTQDLTTEEQQLVSRVQFNFYQKSTVFQDRSLGERRLNSGILGASVANLSITGLRDDVVIHLRNTEPIPANFVATCVFWDFGLNNGSGGWSSSGCFVQNSTDAETVCSCNHLTSFAILLDLSREPLTSRLQATILTFITYIGCGISAIFLSVTLLTYLAFGKLRKDIPSKILIQLCLALLLLNLVFLVDAWLALYPDSVGLCISTAWFLHYFLLVAFTWMGLEAVHMYLALVKVFNSYISRYMLKFSLVGWGVPMIVVIIVIAIDKNNYGLVSYGKFPDGTSDDFCWLKNDIAFYVAVVAYFCVIFLFNLVMFIVVLIQLCRIKRQNPHNALHRTTLQDVRSVTGITILLGLTWGFAFFAWGPVNLPFMYLFAIFNSLQGFFIFVFHCAVKENVRRQWRTYLCCGRMRLAENSEWSRTATQKTAKKSSVTRITSLKSSNNSSSSSSFLVSESSEHINGSGSPFEDRTITAAEDPRVDVILNEINMQNRNQQTA